MKRFHSINDVRTWVANSFPYMSNTQTQRVTDAIHKKIFDQHLVWGEDWSKFLDSITVEQADEWAGPDVKRCYVRSMKGDWYVQKEHNNPWGFALFSEDKTYPGGFGVTDFQMVPDDQVPADVKERLGFILED